MAYHFQRFNCNKIKAKKNRSYLITVHYDETLMVEAVTHLSNLKVDLLICLVRFCAAFEIFQCQSR